MVGVLGGLEAPLQIGKLIAKQPRLLPIAVGSREMQLAMCRSIAVSGLRPVLDRTFALSDLAEAFRYQESGRHFGKIVVRSEEHTSELQSLMRSSYAVFCLKNKT